MKNKEIELNLSKDDGSLIFCGFIIKTTSLERLENQRLIEESHGNFEERQ